MKRDIIKIDEELCDGCGLCIPNCHEGALQIIDEKARLISDLMCDGLGDCIGHCPQGAITIETYITKITSLIDDAKINTITVMMMEVPCCSGLLQIVKTATSQAKRKVPVKALIIGIKGEVISEEWI